jgi:hypothetical protein
MFTAVRLRICPRLLVSPWAAYIMRAKAWWEKGELGVDFVTAPEWIGQAFAVLDSEQNKALDFKRENKK